MKKIKICHLYYDLLNLYGEDGNIKALTYQLLKQNIDLIVEKKSINDNIEFNNYDIVYIGGGTEKNIKIASDHLIQYRDILKEYITNNGFLIITGNAFNLLGKEIKNSNIKTLKLFDFSSSNRDKRIVNQYLLEYNNNYLLGFINSYYIVDLNNEKDMSNYKYSLEKNDNKLFFLRKNNIFATPLIGPFLVKNPYIHEELIKEILKSINLTYNKKNSDFKEDILAYTNYINKNYNNII